MASRTKQKEEARARRVAEEQARTERTRRQRRLRIVGGTVLGAVVIVVALILINSGNKSGGLKTGTEANATVSTVNAMFAGIPQSGATLGSPNAKVTMTYYGDYQCPVCADFTLSGGFPELVSKDVRQGKVKVVYASFCTATCNGPDGLSGFNNQQVAGLAAGKQNKFWHYTELFYRQQGQEGTSYANEAYLTRLAQQAGVNVSQWKTDRQNPALTTQVNADQATARRIGVSGTPTLVFTGPKGQAVPSQGVPNYAQLERAVQQVS